MKKKVELNKLVTDKLLQNTEEFAKNKTEKWNEIFDRIYH